MRGAVYNNGELAGYLNKTAEGQFSFSYDPAYYKDSSKPAISLTLPKTQPVHTSNYLFAFFQGLLAEGVNKDIQCRILKIDEQDDFTRLLRTAGEDTIGAITIQPIDK